MSTGDECFATYQSNIPGIDWPPVLMGPAATLSVLLAQLDESQWLAPHEIAERQFRQVGILADYCAKHSKNFAGRLSRAGLKPDDLTTSSGFAKLPVLTRREVQSSGLALYCDAVPQNHGVGGEVKTSGSTGEPVVVRRTRVNQLMWLAMTMREHLWHERDFRGGLCAIRANISSYSRQDNWGPPASLLYRTGPSLSLPIATDAKQLAEWIVDFKPDNLLIYPSTLDAFTRYCRERAIKMPWLHHIRTIGETLSSAIRAEAQAHFGAKIADSYSSQEIGYIAIQCPVSGLYHTMAEGAIAEVLNDKGEACEVGEIGRVTVTDLHNFATPMLRYDIGDYAEIGPPCPCGRGLPVWTRILGRERNLILMPDGTRHWPVTGFNSCRHIAPVSQYQLIQLDRETIEARLVVDRPLSRDEEEALRAMFRACAGHPFALQYTYFADRIPVGPSGKFEEFVCRAMA